MNAPILLRALLEVASTCAIAAPLVAQATAPAPRPDPDATVRAIVQEALARGDAFAKLRELCGESPHRMPGSTDLANAEQWAVRRMKADGLENVRLEPCTVPHWSRGTIASLAVASPADATATRLPILALGGSVATPKGGVRGELVRVTSFDELRALGAAVRGKIVLFDRPMDPAELDPFEAYGNAVGQRAQGPIEAARLGAVAAIVRSMTLRLDDVPHTGSTRFDPTARIPAAAVSTAGAARLAELLRAKGRVELALELDCQDLGEVTANNVVGEIVGSELPNEIVVVGGHVDGWDAGEGAHDDGAGCVESMEALRLVKALGLAPRRTIRCVLWTNEEFGLKGALAYRDAHAKELDGHVLALETDRGGFAPRGFETGATGPALDALRAIVARLEPFGASMLRAGDGGADVGPLAAAGVTTIGFVPDPSRYFDVHHSARDTIEAVHPRELELSAGVIAALAWSVADRAERLPRTPPKSAVTGPAEAKK